MKRTLTVALLAIALIFTMGVAVFADTPDLSDLLPANNNTATTNTSNEIARENNTVANTNVNSTNQNTPEKLVNTGIGSTTIPLIAIFVIASIYAYKKVREYNV